MFEHAVFLDRETVDKGDLEFSRLESTARFWRWFEYSNAEDIADRVKNTEIIVTNKCVIDQHAISRATELKLIVLSATGTDNVDLTSAAQHGVAVCNIRDYASTAVAQRTITLMLNLLTGQPWYRDRVRSGEWSAARQFCLYDRPIREAQGLILGIIGSGVLGQAVANLAKGLGMTVLHSERKGQSPRPERTPFETVIDQADVISIHCPLNDETRGLLDRCLMEKMKDDALIINTARGGIVEESDLAECLREGIIGGAAIDTLSQEPPPLDHVLLAPDIPNLIVTPHNAWASRSSRQTAVDQIAFVIKAFAAGQPINQVA